ncbi:MAG: DUF262 domain-containing protein [Gordonia sp. (in: high G+C Gram-positive bacteria)]|uniref:DUF262 domain-containing protein n=1 Tax=Gordonia sp. (in: high G+C Gram-positive bacteria) TaxID=84139 RepID=UPI0039E6058B
MDTPLDAASISAGALFSNSTFRVPEFQREYSWQKDEVEEFFDDLSGSLRQDSYFLGLIIVTGEDETKDIVDGQQRILTLTLLASILHREALEYDRKALADRLRSNFLVSIDYRTDEERPRVTLSSKSDNEDLQKIITGDAKGKPNRNKETISLLMDAHDVMSAKLAHNLKENPFKQLGNWADFITNRLYMARFVHPDQGSAYRVFEVINTRGKELTTADLLKSYVLSQTPDSSRLDRYSEWNEISNAFGPEQKTSLVQFIRHSVTVTHGHILPRDLYDVLTARTGGTRHPVPPVELMKQLSDTLPIYRQMMDPTVDGPGSEAELAVFSVLNQLGVSSVRPILMAIHSTKDSDIGVKNILRLVVRRIVVGSLGTGNVERRFGVTAKSIHDSGSWEDALKALDDLNPDKEDFVESVHKRSMNKRTLSIVRESVLENTITPKGEGNLFFIKPRSADWSPTPEDRVVYWVTTVGNTFLSSLPRRPMSSSSWDGFKNHLASTGIPNEWTKEITDFKEWNVEAIEEVGLEMGMRAAEVWYE